jgi:hypothetical protein
VLLSYIEQMAAYFTQKNIHGMQADKIKAG